MQHLTLYFPDDHWKDTYGIKQDNDPGIYICQGGAAFANMLKRRLVEHIHETTTISYKTWECEYSAKESGQQNPRTKVSSSVPKRSVDSYPK